MAGQDIFIYEAIKEAGKSVFTQRLGAVVVSRNRIVGRGFNYAHGTGQPHIDGRHAEISALNNTAAKYRKDATVYVVRLGRADAVRKSKPCESCVKIMEKMGVKYVWYSDNDGIWYRLII